jgi:hypothetical protein
MNFHAVKFRRLPLLAGAAMAMVLSVHAQQGGEPIIFSSPDGDGVSSNLTRLSKPIDVPDTFEATPPGFGVNLPSGEAPPPVIPPAVSISEGQQLQNLLNPKKDWTLMTPGEILGVTSPEKIFQVPEFDAMGLRKNPSALENFLGRQNESQFAATNGFSSDNPASAWGGASNRDFQSDTPDPVSDNPGSTPQTLSQLFNNAPQRNDNFAGQNAGANLWQQFGGSSPLPTPDSAQQTEMDQFKELLGASTPDTAATRSSSSSGSAFFSPQPSANNNFGQPTVTVNPFGASYTPLTSGIGTPTGLTPLPTVAGQSSIQSEIAPAWTPQSPPWMSQGPQPFVIPQRKF